MEVDQSGPTAEVAVKLAFSREEKSRLLQEHNLYSRLHSSGVQGISDDIGLFVDEEPLLDAQGPYALLLSYAGVSLVKHPLDFCQVSSHPLLYLYDSNSVCRYSIKRALLATPRLIYGADVLHSDILLKKRKIEK